MNRYGALKVPQSLQNQLLDYRRRVWRIKLIEAIGIAIVGIALAFLAVYCWDRFADMPGTLRMVLLATAGVAIAVIPWFVYRWMLRYRKLESLARLLARKMPSIGDQLLGVIELTHSDSEQARSPALCQAAMQQVAKDASSKNFVDAAPPSNYRLFGTLAGLLVLVVATLGVLYPAASKNALTRLVAPWGTTPRYTFTRIAEIDPEVVVPHGESTVFQVALDEGTRWHPETAELTIGRGQPVTAKLTDGKYSFELPPQIQSQPMQIRVGDLGTEVSLKPMLRPELSSVVANVELPEYLGRPEAQQIDSRTGRVTMVRGSKAVVMATANRDLQQGKINQQPRKPEGARLASEPLAVNDVQALTFDWKDQYGLSGKEPFELAVEAIDDEAPTLIVDGLPRQAVVLDSEMLKFTVQSNDDFGIKRVGLMWRGLDPRLAETIAKGEKPLGAGSHEADDLELSGTFSAKSLGIEPQPIELFVWAEDYLPGRDRVFSAPHVLYILTPDQHAIWMTEQLSKWHRQALDVRDRERQLYESNKALRDLDPEQLNAPDNRRAVERQASAERSNGRRLDRLGKIGDQLVKAASRNPEIGVGHLERWAEMLQVLGDLSENRMPSVADLLDDAAKAPSKIATAKSGPGGPKAGQVRAAGGGAPTKPDEGPSPKLRPAPQLVDMESSANSPDEGAESEPGPPKKPNSPSLRLPTTTVMGKSQPKKDPGKTPQQQEMQQAVEEQEGLLAEFDKLADEMNAVLANLEGSTLVKRLKAASREQNLVATKLTSHLKPAFGVSEYSIQEGTREELTKLQQIEQKSVQKVSYIMDDLSAYFERRRFMQFKATLDEMKQTDILGGLRDLSTSIASRQGLSVAECEYWADSLDRWAENLVDPACSGSCPGGKSPESLPPSIVLEVLQILEAEINLRDETRVAEQAESAMEPDEYTAAADALAATQDEINERVVRVIERISELPDARKHFGKELAMLSQVDQVMAEATSILRQPETGPPAIAAETEAIELILRSKRINPNGGGGGGASPGGGSGGGKTVDSALALVGKGRNEKEVRQSRDVTQTTGETGTIYPEEFRQGLDQYFNRLGDN